jgi:hypothetical protein
VHIFVNLPDATVTESAVVLLPHKQQLTAEMTVSIAYIMDFIQLPAQLDRNYEKFDTASALRTTILNAGDSEKKRSRLLKRLLPSTCWTRCLALVEGSEFIIEHHWYKHVFGVKLIQIGLRLDRVHVVCLFLNNEYCPTHK